MHNLFLITILYRSCGDCFWYSGQVAKKWLLLQWGQCRLFCCFPLVLVLFEIVTKDYHSLSEVVICGLIAGWKTALELSLPNRFWLFICDDSL